MQLTREDAKKIQSSTMSPRLKDMLLSRQPPRALTDREFLEGHGRLLDQFGGDEGEANWIISQAMANGYKPSESDVYIDQLARFPGDKEAFVPAGDARGHIKRVCESRGIRCMGAVSSSGSEPVEDPSASDIPLGQDIVEEVFHEEVQKDPSLAWLDKHDLTALAVEKHGPSKGV
jgi:hypothetical protein